MCSKVRFRAAAVRYASVGSGFSPRTGAEKATDGAGGSGYGDRLHGFMPLTLHFRIPGRCRLPHRPARAGVLCSGGVGDPLVRGVGLPVDAVGVDLQQDCDAVPGPAATSVAGTPEFSHSDTAAWRRS
jgi:hypothetical protein